MSPLQDPTGGPDGRGGPADAGDAYRPLFEHAPLPSWVFDLQSLRILAVNRAAQQDYGYSEAEFLALRITDLRPPEDESRLLDHLQQPADTRNLVNRQWRHRRRNGEVFPVEIHSEPVRFASRDARVVQARDITVRLQVLEAQRSSERRYRDIVETAQEGIWVLDAQACTTFVNPKMAQMLGTTVAAMQGRALTDFMDEAGRRIAESKLEQRRQGHAEQHEFCFQRADGSLLWTWISTNPVLDDQGAYAGALAMVTDITERKRIEARDASRDEAMQLVVSGAPLRQVLEAIVRGIEAAEPGLLGSVLLMDSSARRLRIGAAPSLPEAFNAAADGLPVGADNASCGAAAHTGQRVIVHDVRVDPRWAHVREHAEQAGLVACWSQPILSRAGGVLGTFGVYHRHPHTPGLAEMAAVSEAAQLAAIAIERKQSEEALRQAQKMESLGTLAGGIAHDFNNILGALLANVSLVKQTAGVPDEASERIRQIEQSALRARLLVHQILAFSRRQPHQAVRQPLAPLVEDALSLLRATLPANVQLHTRIATGLPLASVDATQVQQVLLNLCTNAWHAMPSGGGQIEIGLEAHRPARTGLSANTGLAPPGPGLHLWVRDDGSGMDEEVRARIFEPFFTTKPVGSGTGLGLAVVHGIVAEHGGSITVHSAPGRGATFHIHLPGVADDAVDQAALADDIAAARPPAEPAAPALATQGAGVTAAAPGVSGRVLLVDDDAVMLITGEALLVGHGHGVTTASGGAEALAALLEHPDRFDVVITDYNMPDCSGLDVARGVASVRPDLPVLICSGYIDAELLQHAQDAGVQALVRKENVVEELPAAIERALASRPH